MPNRLTLRPDRRSVRKRSRSRTSKSPCGLHRRSRRTSRSGRWAGLKNVDDSPHRFISYRPRLGDHLRRRRRVRTLRRSPQRDPLSVTRHRRPIPQASGTNTVPQCSTRLRRSCTHQSQLPQTSISAAATIIPDSSAARSRTQSPSPLLAACSQHRRLPVHP